MRKARSITAYRPRRVTASSERDTCTRIGGGRNLLSAWQAVCNIGGRSTPKDARAHFRTFDTHWQAAKCQKIRKIACALAEAPLALRLVLYTVTDLANTHVPSDQLQIIYGRPRGSDEDPGTENSSLCPLNLTRILHILPVLSMCNVMPSTSGLGLAMSHSKMWTH